MQDNELVLHLRGWRMATAEVTYYLPDHPSLLQTFTWQTLDLAPSYPRVHKFLDFWKREIDAVIHSVNLASSGANLHMTTMSAERSDWGGTETGIGGTETGISNDRLRTSHRLM